MTYARFRGTIKRAEVERGLERTPGELRAIAERLLARFAPTADPGPGPLADDGAALALWGTEKPDAFLAWQDEHGGLARCVEVVLAALAFQRATFEWDSSVWALRRARPAQGLANLGARPWTWLRVADVDRKERARALNAAGESRSWVVRAAVAYAFAGAPYTEADVAEARHADVDEDANVTFGVLAAMREHEIPPSKLDRAYDIADVITPAAIAKALGSDAVGPLRLERAYGELAALGAPDALRALAEFADEPDAWDAMASIAPSRAAVAALAPMFDDRAAPPRRSIGYHLARAWYRELGVALGDGALPPDPGWVSPWPATAAKTPKPKSKSKQPAPAITETITEAIHWKPGQREALLAMEADSRDGSCDKRAKSLIAEANAGSALLMQLQYLTDPVARDVLARAPTGWYAQIDDVEHVLARFGLDELDRVIALVRTKPETLAALANVESPRVAPLMARGFAIIKKQKAVGRAWLERFGKAARIGLSAGDFDKAQRDANAKALALIDKTATPSTELPAKRPAIPAVFDLKRVPQPITPDRTALAGEALVELAQLCKATLPDGHPALDAAVARYTPDSLAAFAWGLFRQWLVASGPPKEKWALYAVGKLGGEAEAKALGRLARAWAPRGNPARAQEAVETLALMRSRAGLVEIYDIARTVQSKALAARAEAVFARVAGELGITVEDLADKLVPEVTEADLTFGGHRVAFDARLVPVLPVKPDGDDVARWRALEKQCKQIARAQLARLEQAMADAHRMTFAHFAEVYLMHPLLRELARGVVWGAYERPGAALVQTFRIGDDAAPLDLRGRALELAIDRTYGIVHAAELDDAERAAWAAAIPAQAVDQLARTVFPATDAKACARRLATHVGAVVPTAGLLALQRRSWRRGEAVQGGRYYTIHREGTHAGRTWSSTIAFLPGIYLGSPTQEPTQGIDQIELRAEGDPPRAILSELERDIAGLT